MYEDYPRCAKVKCASCEEGHCTILNKKNFKNDNCPFFKTKEQVEKELAYCEKRLADIKKVEE